METGDTISQETASKVFEPARFWIVKRKNRHFHVVSLNESVYSCTCQSFIFRHEECKHIRMVQGKEWSEDYEVIFE